MTSNIANTTPYLRASRNFPMESQKLSVELSKSYLDIATFVNLRTIGLFPDNVSAITGEQWYLSGISTKQQTLRQVYTFTGAGNIAHNLMFSNISGFTRIYGTFTNGTNWYPLPYVDVTAANNQINVIVTPTNIVITAGGGAPPSITSGFVVLEWLSAS